MAKKIRGGASLPPIRVTPDLMVRIEELVQRDSKRRKRVVSKTEVVRDAIRFYLDHRDDITGSRRHFTGQFQAGQSALRSMLIVLVVLVARIGAMLTVQIDDHTQHQLDNLPPDQAGQVMDNLLSERAVDLVRRALSDVQAQGVHLERRLLDVAADMETERILFEEQS